MTNPLHIPIPQAAQRGWADPALQGTPGAFQAAVDQWMDVCFGATIKSDKVERCDRFIEEALEFVQAVGYSPDRAVALVEYVFGREVGEPRQEVGGVMVTLAAACNAIGIDMSDAAATELARIWTKVDAIRAKQAAKPVGSALPSATHDGPSPSIAELKAATVSGATILLNSGHYFDISRPHESVWTLDDIAHGLAMTCRFAGQARRYYSVAEHSVYVSLLVPPEHAWDALMHDAAEAFIGDIAKPLKELLPDYKMIEKIVEHAVSKRHGLQYPVPDCVKLADIQMLRAEQLQIMGNDDDWKWTFDVPEPDIKIAALAPLPAKTLFIARAAELGKA